MKTDLRRSYMYQSIQAIKMSSQQLAIAVENIDVSKISFVVGQTKAGRNPPINFKYNGKNLLIGLPRVSFPGGVIMRNGEKGDTSYSMMGSLKGCDPYMKERYEGTDPVGVFYNLLTDLDERIIEEAERESVKWFGKKRTGAVVRDCFKPSVNPSATKNESGEYVMNGKYPPSFRAKIPVYDNNVLSEIEDNNKNPVYVKPESLQIVFPKQIQAGVVLSGQIYVLAGGGFGVTWKLQGAQVFPVARERVTDFFKKTVENVEEDQPEETQEQDHQQYQTPDNSQLESETPAPVAPGAPQRKRRAAPASS